MARTQSLETWMRVFSLVETATEHHAAAARLERLAASCDPDVRRGLVSRAEVQRRLGDEASAAAERLRRQRYDEAPADE
jgi:hypothetical protein